MQVVVKMKDGWNREAIARLRAIGLVTESLFSQMRYITGTIDDSKLAKLKASSDVELVEEAISVRVYL
ncbi:MAG: hypothetical protein Q8P36_02290 [bacterium]|nr:hypothetical protein [bacterium]